MDDSTTARHCIWFRRDLRIQDNHALTQACSNASSLVIAIYVITPQTFKAHNGAAIQADFILRNLRTLQDELKKRNIALRIVEAKTYTSSVKQIVDFCKEYKINKLFANAEVLVDEVARDELLAGKLATQNIDFELYHDATILAPNRVLKQDGTPFKVFTHFKKTWLKEVQVADYSLHKTLRKRSKMLGVASRIPAAMQGFEYQGGAAAAWPAGERVAHKMLKDFCQHKLRDYRKLRDFPSKDATSKLSPYLAQGVLSVRECIAMMLQETDSHYLTDLYKESGVACWLDELIWREFYYAIVVHFPKVVKNKAFNSKTENLKWHNNPAHFKAWCRGQTGYPIVDAAMRSLYQNGWMHNRLRMVVAMFLTKTLFIDWRLGEKYFMQQLIDGDFASNNGGWQWSASVGTDAAPYFRIFNPTTQSERFDPTGEFIRQYCPELASCSNKEIHNPSDKLRLELGYPKPVVDYATMRKLVIAEFKKVTYSHH